jgi:hypothetical protein
MAQDKITEIFDITSLEANKTKFLSVIKETLAEVEKLGVSIKANTTIGGSASNNQKASSATKEMEAAAKEYTATWKRLLKERDDAEKESRRLEMANTKEVLALRKEVARQEAELRKLDIAGSKEAIAIQKELAKQRKAQLAEQAKEAAQIAKAEKNVVDLTKAEQVLILKIKEKEAAYKQSYLTLGASASQTIKLKDETNALKDTQNKMNQAIGNYRSNVGNYSSAWNGLGMSIQQVAREMPNFAQSMQLGFLAISNNLPILADELKRAKDNIADLKKEGKDAPSLFSQIAASVFSWQTALTIGITLLVKYGAEIVDWATNVSNAEKMMRSYEKALGDTIKSESEGISKLVAAKAAINDNSVSRGTQVKLLNEAKAAYPQYLSSLDIELNTTDEINAALQQQMDIRIGIAKTKAAEATLSEATAEQIKAFQELNKEASLWDRFLASFTLKGADANEVYNKLTDSAKELALAEEANWKAGKLTDDQYLVKIKKIIEISDAQKKESAAVDLVRYANDDLTMSLVKEIAELEKRRVEVTKNIDKYPALLGARRKEIEYIDQTILKLRGEISERENLLNLQQARVASFGISEEERQLIAAQNYARLFKEGTKERLNADIAAKKIELRVNLKALKDKENVDVSYLASDKNYNQKYATLRAEAISKSNDEILRMQDDFNKKQAKAAKAANKPKPEDKTADIILQQMNDVALNEQINIDKRLTAIREELDKGLISISEYQNKKKIIVKEGEDSILKLQIKALDDYLIKVGLNAEGRAKVQEMITTKHKEEIKRRQAADEEESLQRAEARKLDFEEDTKRANRIFDELLKDYDKKDKKRQDDADKEKDIQAQKLRYIQQIALETSELIFTLLDAQTQKEISAAEKRSEALTAEYDLKRSAVEKASISDEEKTARKLVLDAEEAESQKKIDNEIRDLKIKQAKFDKAQALVTIAINTAIALANAKNLGTLGALSPFIIGLAAAQAAVVLATPLPEYAKGKKASDSYEGLAIAGEKGTEMKIDKDGSLQLLTKPTLIHTKRGDTILSNKELMSGELGKHIKTGKEKANYDELIKAYSYHTDRTIKAIKNSPSNIIIDNSNYNLSLKRARV